jgi:thioesterase domain-containing protein
VALEQKNMIEKRLSQLERQILLSALINWEEATIRVEEAKIVKEFIDKIRELQPRGPWSCMGTAAIRSHF